jgi:hypothetical protein
MTIYLLTITLVVGIFMFIRFIISWNWNLFHTAFGYKEYAMLVSKLEKEGIVYKTQTIIDIDRPDRTTIDQKQFDIYIKKRDQQKGRIIVKCLFYNLTHEAE